MEVHGHMSLRDRGHIIGDQDTIHEEVRPYEDKMNPTQDALVLYGGNITMSSGPITRSWAKTLKQNF